ncbi:hypothetical protein [Aliarcobacter cryaerophilus]|uniref:hypothetical protein n=1 Tax=Aliarcobacter cryaerophilus TaxID=28198 RepID=UPI00112F65A4|nr:hypothetical protein [Aliarcobacter cryaerophilus]
MSKKIDPDTLKQFSKLFDDIKDEIKSDLRELKEELRKIKEITSPEYDLTTRAGVMEYLGYKSTNTITRLIREGKFKKGYHYHREIKNNVSRIIFVSGAIEEYKRENPKKDKTK